MLTFPALPNLLVPPYSHVLIILVTFLATYIRILGKDFFWVIDDIEGIARFSEHLDIKKNDKGETIECKKVDSYEIVIGKDDKGQEVKKQVKFLSFIPELGFPGSVLRFLRLQIGKKFSVLGENENGHPIYGFKQSARRHHLLSMAVHLSAVILAYFTFKPYLGSNIAFAACLLYSVHPLTTQTVAWVSGINYSLAMLFSLAIIRVASIPDFHFSIPLVIFFSFCSGVVLYIGCLTWIILLLLGLKWAAFASGIVGTFILFWKGSETKNYRTKAFKEQNMDHTTSLNFRKPIVMLKTLWYYFPIVFLPLKMGLYHVWGYFYEEPIERIDRMFWAGLAVLGLMVSGFFYGGIDIQIGIVWFLSFIFLFSNFITAQQFVADRYATVPAFGICIILAKLLYPTPLFWMLLGLYAMRTFMHLPAFKNEVDYYLSNFLNFRKSEVSLGNLGVAYMNQQMPGSAVDTWIMSSKVNPFYDVAWYNLYSIFKANGRFPEAADFLRKCLKAKIVHFKDKWEAELKQFEQQMGKQQPANGKDLIDQANEEWKKYGKR